MLYREIMAVCSQIHTKHRNTVCGQNVETPRRFVRTFRRFDGPYSLHLHSDACLDFKALRTLFLTFPFLCQFLLIFSLFTSPIISSFFHSFLLTLSALMPLLRFPYTTGLSITELNKNHTCLNFNEIVPCTCWLV